MTLLLIFKYLSSAVIITIVSEVVRRNERLGALLAALPFVSIITLFWIYYESAPSERMEKTSNHMYYIFWYVLPTLPMFLLFPRMQQMLGFYGAVLAGSALTLVLFVCLRTAAVRFGIAL